MASETKITKAEQTKATVKKLLCIAKREFSQKGYSRASMEEIVKVAGMTRGALYHHFKGKPGLFYAVYCEAQREIGRRIEKCARTAPDLWGQLVNGCHGFLEASSDPELQQIVVIDAPAVLKWETVRQVDSSLEGSGFSLLKESLAALIAEETIKPLPLDALAHLLNGAMDEAAIWISKSSNTGTAIEESKTVLDEILTALRRPKSSKA